MITQRSITHPTARLLAAAAVAAALATDTGHSRDLMAGDGYDKLCLVTTAPGGKPLPTVCVFSPLAAVDAVSPTGAPA